MLAPDAPGGFATLTLFTVKAFTEGRLRRERHQHHLRRPLPGCGRLRDEHGSRTTGGGIEFGTAVQSVFNNGFCSTLAYSTTLT